MAEKKPDFEKDLKALEEIVEALEEGGLPLDTALKRFEDGVKLSRRCQQVLAEAEKKIEILLKNATGELEAAPFAEEEGGAAQAPSKPPAAEAKAKAAPKDDTASVVIEEETVAHRETVVFEGEEPEPEDDDVQEDFFF